VKAVNIENTQKREGNLKNTAASIEEASGDAPGSD
jgi:hypothetical protein